MKKLIQFFLLVMLPIAPSVTAAEVQPLKVLLVSASKEYASHESLTKFQSELTKQGVTSSRAFGEDKGTGIAELETLARHDVLLLFTRRVTLPTAQLEAVKKHFDQGKGFVGVRTASHGIQNWIPDVKAFDTQIIGGSYNGHYKDDEPATLKYNPQHLDHPILHGLPPFPTRGKLYKNPTVAADSQILIHATNQSGNTEPVAWTRTVDNSKIFYTSLGVPEDFDQPEFAKMMVNAVLWAGGRK